MRIKEAVAHIMVGMTDMPQQIGPFRVSREIGRGGMGVVYLARDERLDRDVAIKALPEELASDPDRLIRFEREGKSLAQLNHPNVAGIYGVEEQDGRKFLILEYVEGDTLGDRLDAGPISIDEAMELAVGIAAGLDAAHEVGVIHRDLKPDNIKITPEGQIKVLDFGLAKASGTSSGTSLPASTMRTTPRSPTIPGAIMGTAAYMSPEQARGRSVDKRTDVWSFGVVLYEMLTGLSPFVGETVSDSIGAVLHKDVELHRLPSGSSGLLRHLLRRCLQRDKSKRLRDIGDARLELMAIASGESDDEPQATIAPSSKRALIIGAVAVVLAAALTGFGVWRAMQPQPPQVARLSLPQPQDQTWKNDSSSNTFAISRDGRSIVYYSWRRVADQVESVLVLRHRDQTEAITLTDLGLFVSEPFFSPDGQWIGYMTEDELRAVSVTGGTPRRICGLHGLPGEPRGAVWRTDDVVVFGTESGGLYSVPATGGRPVALTQLAEGERSHSWPDTVPETDTILFSILREDIAHLAWYSLETGEQKIFLEGKRFPRYLAPGYLLYMQRDELRADTFDPKRLQLGGNPVMLDERPFVNPWSGIAEFAIGQDGTLVYGNEFRTPKRRTLVWVDRQGVEQETAFGHGSYGHLAMSPSGAQVAIETYGERFEVWLGDTQTETRIPFNADSGFNPIWSSDGSQIIWGSGQTLALRRRMADGSGPVEELEAKGILKTMTPDGQYIVVMKQGQSTSWDLWLAPPEGEPVPFIVESGLQLDCAFSNDGKWVAYRSVSDGRSDVFVCPFPNVTEGRVRVPGSGSKSRPIWRQDGTELFFIQDSVKLMAAPMTTTPTLSIGEPKLLYADLNAKLDTGTKYAPMPDGQRFLVIKEDPAFLTPRREIHVVVNWIEVLKAKLDK